MSIDQEIIKAPPDPRLTSFGQRIRYAREFRGMTGVELAQELGIPSQTLSTWERGTMPTQDAFLLAEQLEAILRIDRLWFAGWGLNGRYAADLDCPAHRIPELPFDGSERHTGARGATFGFLHNLADRDLETLGHGETPDDYAAA